MKRVKCWSAEEESNRHSRFLKFEATRVGWVKPSEISVWRNEVMTPYSFLQPIVPYLHASRCHSWLVWFLTSYHSKAALWVFNTVSPSAP